MLSTFVSTVKLLLGQRRPQVLRSADIEADSSPFQYAARFARALPEVKGLKTAIINSVRPVETRSGSVHCVSLEVARAEVPGDGEPEFIHDALHLGHDAWRTTPSTQTFPKRVSGFSSLAGGRLRSSIHLAHALRVRRRAVGPVRSSDVARSPCRAPHPFQVQASRLHCEK